MVEGRLGDGSPFCVRGGRCNEMVTLRPKGFTTLSSFEADDLSLDGGML